MTREEEALALGTSDRCADLFRLSESRCDLHSWSLSSEETTSMAEGSPGVSLPRPSL
jgi:hypothetical protein